MSVMTMSPPQQGQISQGFLGAASVGAVLSVSFGGLSGTPRIWRMARISLTRTPLDKKP
jgi:hypothetical protein